MTQDRLDWARRLQAIAQTGLAYGEPTVYDRDRYDQVRRIAAEMIASNGNADEFETVFAAEAGHATPKLDVRGAVFRGDAILLVDDTQHELDDEIAEARFFSRDTLPELDLARITPDSYIDRFYEHREHPEWPTDFD